MGSTLLADCVAVALGFIGWWKCWEETQVMTQHAVFLLPSTESFPTYVDVATVKLVSIKMAEILSPNVSFKALLVGTRQFPFCYKCTIAK